MTTSVLVVNRGPEYVEVGTMAVGVPVEQGDGTMVRLATESTVRRLAPGDYVEMNIYKSQELQVKEVSAQATKTRIMGVASV